MSRAGSENRAKRENPPMGDSQRPRVALGPLLLLCFYASGAAALIDQVVWVRQLIPLVGAATPAVSTVLAAFMGGLALGGLLAGRWIDRRPGLALPAYSGLEALTALLTLALPWAFGWLEGTPYPLPWAFLLVLLPTTAMGATLPILAKVSTWRREEVGSSIADLYAANTTGAMTGCLLAGYVGIPLLGLNGSLKVAAGLNLLAAGLPWLAWKVAGQPPKELEEEEEAAIALPQRSLAITLFAFCGGLGLAFEVLWTRALITYLSNSVYAFSAMLFVFLAGLSLGGMLIGYVCDRLKDPFRALAMVVCGVGLAGLLARQTVLLLPGMLEQGSRAIPTFGAYLLLQVVMAALVLLPQTVLLGCSFPLVARLVTGKLTGLGADVGQAYFCNTVAGIAGSLLAGFVLIPGPGVQSSIVGLSVLAVLVGMAALLRCGQRPLALGAGALAVPLLFLSSPWQPRLLLRGLDSASILHNGIASTHIAEWEPIYVKDGRNATVVVGERQGQRTLSINGQLQASSIKEDRFIQEALGHLPMLFASNPRSVLVIGMGTGMTSASVARHAPSRLRLAEMEPAVLAAGPLFKEWNSPLWQLPGFQPTLIDGRVLVARGAETYDVITSDPIHPLESAASPLYTVEHFRNCRQSLAEDGVMAQWLPLYALSEDDSRRVMGSFVEAFPQASLWCWYPRTNKGDSILLATRDGKPLDVSHLQARLETLQREGVATWKSPEEVLGGFVMGGERLREYSRGLLHTDDRPVLEFSAPRSAYLWTDARYRSDLAAVIEGGGDDLPDFTPSRGPWMEQAMRGFAAQGRESKVSRLAYLIETGRSQKH